MTELMQSDTDAGLGDEFAMFADEAAAWAELTLPTALEGWPDDGSVMDSRQSAPTTSGGDDG